MKLKIYQFTEYVLVRACWNIIAKMKYHEDVDPNVYKNKDGKFKLTGLYGKFGEYDGLQFAFKPEMIRILIIYGKNGGIFLFPISM
jgi:hypothetical protein